MNFINRAGLPVSVFAACLLLLVCTVVGGQSSATLTGPVVGYVFSAPEGKLRPVRGILGSATIGDPLPLDFAISQAWTLDDRHFVVSTGASSELQVLGMENDGPTLAVISGAPAAPSQAAFSMHGTAAAFYYAGSQDVRVFTGLPGKPAVSQTTGLSSLDGQSLTHIAISDDGALVVYSVAEVDRESIYVWTSSSASSRFVFSVVAAGGIAIAGNGSAYITDRGANEVFAIPNARSAASPRFLLGERDGLSRPGDVAISADNQVYIANTGSGAVMALDSSGRNLRTQHCNCVLTGLSLLRDSVFRLTEGLRQPVHLLKASSNGDQMMFIPALHDIH